MTKDELQIDLLERVITISNELIEFYNNGEETNSEDVLNCASAQVALAIELISNSGQSMKAFGKGEIQDKIRADFIENILKEVSISYIRSSRV